jgi:hypothetical protein
VCEGTHWETVRADQFDCWFASMKGLFAALHSALRAKPS